MKQRKKINRKKVAFLFFFIITILIILIYIYRLIPKRYKNIYNIKSYTITEKYNNKERYYSYKVTKNSNKYEFSIEGSYSKKHKNLSKIMVRNGCLSALFMEKEKVEICKISNTYSTSFYKRKINNKIGKKINGLDVYQGLKKKYMVWNYKNFIMIKNNSIKEISLFNKDYYILKNVIEVNNKLYIPDYDSKYFFTKLYSVDYETGKVETHDIGKKIYHNSYILGTYDGLIYLYDNEMSKEYGIDTRENHVYNVKNSILIDGNFEYISENKLKKNTYYFTDTHNFYYKIKNKKLVYDTPTTEIYVTNMDVDKIIYQNKKEVVFLSGDTVYYSDGVQTLKKELSYSEWLFNNKNIYAF